ncbi:hypothetical protein [uncultured Helicobacter sp.]|uniref:hypothetical protein n=1 Tax=uncultured Helicobacter sp. TaxID=175537 RepID=UPI0026062226|nr:hypothetical protein [uncultured Helicobacter sp.]
MKKIILYILLITQGFAVGFADRLFMSDEEIARAERIEAEKAKRTKHFFGIEGGVGFYDYTFAPFVAFNPLVLGITKAPTLGYSVSILGGFQRYDSEKIGIRHTFGVKYDWGYDMGRFGGENKADYKGNDFYILGFFYYALDGLFDFVKTNDNRFGMNVGMSFDFNMNYSKNEKNGNKSIGGGGFVGRLRVGFYTQVENNVFDCNLSFPLAGVGFGDLMMPSTLTLGYKYLF